MFESRMLDHFLRRLRTGRITVRYWDGKCCSYGDGGPSVTVTLRDPRVVRKALRDPVLAFGEGFTCGDIEINEPELDTFLWILKENRHLVAPWIPVARVHRNATNRRRSQRQNISAHYDVGNDYYKLFLDGTLTYSCAYFEHDEDSLGEAQRHKVDYLLRKLRIQPGHRMLDIGSGWGYLAVAAARDYGALVLGITLSEQQLAGAQALARREGVADTARFLLLNYQDLPQEPARYRYGNGDGRFDRIISVGMFEHVGRGQQHKYFEVVGDLLAEGGSSVLHTITSQTSTRTDSWVDRYIFPGGHLPTASEVERELADHGFWSVDRENLWRHYVRTLSCWRMNHQAHRDQIIDLLGLEFYRMRTLWLAGSQAGFAHGDLGLSQFVFTQGKPATWPMTRRYMYTQAATRHLPPQPDAAVPSTSKPPLADVHTARRLMTDHMH